MLRQGDAVKSELMIETRELKKWFPVKKGILGTTKSYVKAVEAVNLQIEKGMTYGLVGESGSGKTTLGRMIIKLLDPTSGEIYFNGEDITGVFGSKKGQDLHKRMQIIFQDPYESLNPRMSVFSLVSEAMWAHRICRGRKELDERVGNLLEKVGLSKQVKGRFPHEFSGGQRQRIGIARALALSPEFVVCDEPVSALDVSIQAQILRLFQQLQKDFQLTYLFISHDLSVVKYISDKIGVMYLGRIVEEATTEELFSNPLHPYTKALLAAVPVPDPRVARRKKIILQDDLLTVDTEIQGCQFSNRCSLRKDICNEEAPGYVNVGQGHKVACHLFS